MILIDNDKGVLTKAHDLLEGSPFTYAIKMESKKAPLSEVLRVHDFNYINKVK